MLENRSIVTCLLSLVEKAYNIAEREQITNDQKPPI